MPPHRQIFFNGEMLKEPSSLDDLEDPPLADLFRGEPVDPFPHELNAAVGYSTVFVIEKAEIALRVVLLPAPFAPRRATIPFSGTSKETPLRTRITSWYLT